MGEEEHEDTFTKGLYFQEMRAPNKKAWPENGRGRDKRQNQREDSLSEWEEEPRRGRAGLADPCREGPAAQSQRQDQVTS